MSRVRQPRQERSRALVDATLDAAQQLLAKEPLATLTTNRIAQLAGISIGSLYQYFPDKQALAGALIERKAARDLDELRAVVTASDDVAATVRALVKGVVALHRRDVPLMRALLALVDVTGRTAAVRSLAAQGREALRPLLAQVPLEGRDPDVVLFVLGRALEEVVHAAVTEAPELLDAPAFEAELAQLVLGSLRISDARASATRRPRSRGSRRTPAP